MIVYIILSLFYVYIMRLFFVFFFFFQAEDGIRDLIVTGVQTCALPISLASETCTGPCWLPVGEPPKRCRYSSDSMKARSASSGPCWFPPSEVRKLDRKSVV